MGYEIAGGLGVKMAAPGREVYVLVGDGSWLMMSGELATAQKSFQTGDIRTTLRLTTTQTYNRIEGLGIVFGLGALAKLVNAAFGFSLSQSANAIVYQSLPDPVRVRVQTTAEGVVQPIAIGLAGISLLALTAGLKLNYLGLSYVFLGLAVVWLIVIFFFKWWLCQGISPGDHEAPPGRIPGRARRPRQRCTAEEPFA